MAATSPQTNIPVQVTAPSPLQPLARSLLSSKRGKSRKLQAAQSQKLRASSADEIQSTRATDALVSAVLKPTPKNVGKSLPQSILTVTVSKIVLL